MSGGHYLVFQGKAIYKKGHCHKESHFLIYQNKVISKKKLILDMPPSWCYYKDIEQYLVWGCHFLKYFRGSGATAPFGPY